MPPAKCLNTRERANRPRDSQQRHEQFRRTMFVWRMICDGSARTANEIHKLMEKDIGWELNKRTILRDCYFLYSTGMIYREIDDDLKPVGLNENLTPRMVIEEVEPLPN